MDKQAKFWDKVANRYSLQAIADLPSYEHKLKTTRTYLSPETTALEIGCGTGSTAVTHAPFVKHYRATDISANMIAIANCKIGESFKEKLTFEQCSIDELKVSEPVDMVLALSLLHLVENKDETMAKIYQWLKPGGVFISSTLCIADSKKWLKPIAHLGYLLGLFPLLRVFTTTELKQSLVTQGFAIEYEWKPDKGMSVFIVARKPL
jgi:ubiquinone/menaquinone biosynthesis C-methylase UbiE